jgi:hypothetical protein
VDTHGRFSPVTAVRAEFGRAVELLDGSRDDVGKVRVRRCPSERFPIVVLSRAPVAEPDRTRETEPTWTTE